MMSVFAGKSFRNHEQVLFHHDRASGLFAIIAIHSTVLGPALGGCRYWTYDDEAAAIDGASAWQRFRHVTLPSIRHVVLVVVLLSTIWTTNSFEAIWLMTQGGPSDATMTFPVLAYFGLQSLRIGEASAVSVSMLPVFAILVFIVAKMLQKDD